MVMAHGMKAKPGDGGPPSATAKAGIGSRRIFPPQFKLQVLDSYRRDADCKGNQRATARKYGIHRRQIQKWLQAEGNLRNSVVSAASSNSSSSSNNNNNCILANKNARALLAATAATAATTATTAECDVGAGVPPGHAQQRLSPVRPVLSPAMATQTQTPSDRPRRPASPALTHAHMPMDLSVRRPSAGAAPATPRLPAARPVAAASARGERSPSPSTPRSRSRSRSPCGRAVLVASASPEIWDLSKGAASPKVDVASCAPPPPADHHPADKPLFKPYLLDAGGRAPAARRAGYDYAAASTYYTYGGATLYDSNVDVGYVYDESGVLQPATYLRQLPLTTHAHPHPHHHHHQRQSYPLDFKLRAIESYYRDDCCKGNQRAVAVKYNVHRRQVQKWLKQEEDLRERVVVVGGEQYAVT